MAWIHNYLLYNFNVLKNIFTLWFDDNQRSDLGRQNHLRGKFHLKTFENVISKRNEARVGE